MIDREEIASMIRDIETYLSDLQAMGISKKSELEEKERYYAVSMIVFAVMNRAVDIGNEIISGSPQIPMPGTYKETFDLLQKHKIISAPVAEKMNKLIFYETKKNIFCANCGSSELHIQ